MRPTDHAYDFLTPAQSPDEIGRLGSYRILKVLGAGGMGIVFQAEDLRLQRHVALKMMRPEAARSQAAKDRFLREARSAAALEHEHIVTIFQVGEENGVPFLAMPCLKGMSLESRLRQAEHGRINIAEVVRFGRQVAEGLAAAHARGFIHRDVKPDNLWLEPTRGGQIKILDFGLARAISGEGHVTQDGAVLGTPSYMAPEQASGGTVDARCDLFSLGVVLYRACTGQLPFRGDSVMAILTALATLEPRPVAELNPAVPPALARLIKDLLRKDPARRPASAQDVTRRLAELEPTVPADQLPQAVGANPWVGMEPTERLATSLINKKRHRAGATSRTLSRRTWLVTIGLVLVFVPMAWLFLSHLLTGREFCAWHVRFSGRHSLSCLWRFPVLCCQIWLPRTNRQKSRISKRGRSRTAAPGIWRGFCNAAMPTGVKAARERSSCLRQVRHCKLLRPLSVNRLPCRPGVQTYAAHGANHRQGDEQAIDHVRYHEHAINRCDGDAE